MIKRLLIVSLVLSLLVPCAAMASSIPVQLVDFLAVYPSPTGAPEWTVLKNDFVPPYGTPGWETTVVPNDTIAIDNVERPGWIKHIFLEIDFLPGLLFVPDVKGVAHYNLPTPHTLALGTPQIILDVAQNSVTWHWVVPQPDQEKLILPDGSFQALHGIARIEVATWCVPLPAAAYPGALLMAGAIGITAWRRYRS